MDPGYSPANLRMIKDNAELLDIPVKVFDSDIFRIVEHVDKSPCYLCARMRRGFLYAHAKALGCNKIALGHHFDDVVETILMSMFYSGEIRTMMPKLHSTNFEGMQLIRPMYMVKEKDIIAWARYNGLKFLKCACRLTESIESGDGEMSSKRQKAKELLAKLKESVPGIDRNIFKSVENVNLDVIIGYRKGGEYFSFLDRYDDVRQ
jgi:tRNA(Ile)-lysidine synthase TilS/MesJ